MKSSIVFTWGCAAIVLMGCADSDAVPVVPVTGKITMNGEPLEGATVTFVPQSDNGRAAAGSTNAEGVYTLNTAGADETGAVAGDYQITVAKFEVKEVRTPEEAMEEMKKRGSLLAPPTSESRNLLPAKYLSPGTSGCAAEVTEDGENTFNFELKK